MRSQLLLLFIKAKAPADEVHRPALIVATFLFAAGCAKQRPRRSGDGMKAIVGVLTAILLTAGSGCAKTDWIERTLVTVDVTGVWSGTTTTSQSGVSLIGNFIVKLELQQRGSRVSGYIHVSPGTTTIASGPLEGEVAGDVFRFKVGRGGLFGELTVNGDEMTGPIGSERQLSIDLRRIDSSAGPPTR